MIFGGVICRFDLSNLSSQFNSLRSADAFLVVAFLFRVKRSDDQKCHCASQATNLIIQHPKLMRKSKQSTKEKIPMVLTLLYFPRNTCERLCARVRCSLHFMPCKISCFLFLKKENENKLPVNKVVTYHNPMKPRALPVSFSPKFLSASSRSYLECPKISHSKAQKW